MNKINTQNYFQNFISNPIYPFLYKVFVKIDRAPIRPPPNIPPTKNGFIPLLDLYMPPVSVPQIIFFYKDDKPDNSSSNNKFIVLPTI